MANYITSDHGIIQLNFSDVAGTIPSSQFAGTPTNGYTLTIVSGVPTWASSSATNATNLLGGAAGSIPYQTAAATTGFIAAGTNGYLLTMVSGSPAWAAAPPSGVTSVTASGSGITASPTTGAVVVANTGVTSITGTANQVVASASTGGVTLSLPQNIDTAANVTHGTLTLGTTLISPSPSSYGSIIVGGSTGGYAGIQFSGTTNNRTFMVSTASSSVVSGVYAVGSSAWDWYFTGGTLTQGTIPAANVSGTVSTATTATNWGSYGAVPAVGASGGTASTIPRSDTNGYTYFGYINSSTGNGENPAVSQVITTNGSDNFYRKSSIASFTTYLSGTAASLTAGAVSSASTSSGSAIDVALINGTAIQYSSNFSAVPSTGVMTAAGGFTVSSDRSKKDNIRLIVNAQEIVQSLNGVKFDWKSNGLPSVGVIAQDVEAVLPELVQTDDEGTKSVNYNGLIGVLIEAVKTLTERVAQLEAK